MATPSVLQRPLRGSRISSFYPVKNLPSLSSLDSAFQLQEYISLLIRLNVHDVDSIVSVPGKTKGQERVGEGEEEVKEEDKTEEKEVKNEVTVDESCWIYEQLRRLAQDLSHPLITMLQQECTRASCPEMKAGEWLYLCVAHGNEGAMEQCCAIDYILHTLDSATALLNSPRAFPSRLSIPQTSHRHFSSLARRLGRIFAHAYFHHREAFEQAEAESSLYARFLSLTSKFDLVPAEFLVIPPRLEEREGSGDEGEVRMPRLLGPNLGDREIGVQQRDPTSESEGWAKMMSERPKSKSPPGLAAGSDSPRRFGRNRTDTMVFSDAFSELVNRGDEYGAGPSGIRRDELEEVGLTGGVIVDGFLVDADTSDEPEEQPEPPKSNSPPIEDPMDGAQLHTFPQPTLELTATTSPEVNLPRARTPEVTVESQIQATPYVVPIEQYEDNAKAVEKTTEEPGVTKEAPVEKDVTKPESPTSEFLVQTEQAPSSVAGEYIVPEDNKIESDEVETDATPSLEAERVVPVEAQALPKGPDAMVESTDAISPSTDPTTKTDDSS